MIFPGKATSPHHHNLLPEELSASCVTSLREDSCAWPPFLLDFRCFSRADFASYLTEMSHSHNLILCWVLWVLANNSQQTCRGLGNPWHTGLCSNVPSLIRPSTHHALCKVIILWPHGSRSLKVLLQKTTTVHHCLSHTIKVFSNQQKLHGHLRVKIYCPLLLVRDCARQWGHHRKGRAEFLPNGAAFMGGQSIFVYYKGE